MTWAELHRASEDAAIEAEQVYRRGDGAAAALIYAKAAELEQQALSMLDAAKVRTRGITAVSAVSLWYKANGFDRAEQLACTMLSDTSVPPFAKVDLRNLIQAIWTESSKKAARVNFLPGQVFVSVKGGDIITGGAPLDLIVEKVQTIQSMFYRTVEFIRDMPLRRRGGPPRDIQESCRPWLFQAAPGSYQFSVAIQQPEQRNFFREDVRPDILAQQFLEILKATASVDASELDRIVPNVDYRSVFLKLSRNLSPTGKTFDAIELRAATGESPVELTAEARKEINKAIKGNRPPDSPGDQGIEDEITGTLRAVDLEKDFLDIVVNNQSLHIVQLGDAMDDVIGPMVNKKVKVNIVRKGTRPPRFRDIELDE